MPRQIPTDGVPRYHRLPKKVAYIREHILGLNRPQFLKQAASVQNFGLSTETLKNVEQKGGGSLTTQTKVYRAINYCLAEQDYFEVEREFLFSPF